MTLVEQQQPFVSALRTPRRYDIPPWIKPDTVPAIFPAMIKANREIEAVSKTRKNQQQGYNFRGIDQVYDMVHSVLADAGIFTAFEVLERRTSVNGKTSKGTEIVLTEIKVEYWFTAEDGSACIIGPVWAEGLDSADKGTNKCMSFAQKYVLLQTFTIPTSDVAEGDRETIERGQRAQQQDQPPVDEGPIGDEMATRIFSAFVALGVSKEQLLAKLNTDNVAGLNKAIVPELLGWRDEIAKDKGAIKRIFGGT